jgi:hypothetical protein
MPLDRHLDRVCGVCARPATGIGVAPSNARRLQDLIWLCDDPDCIEIGNRTMGLKQLEFGRIDGLAASEAAETMGTTIEAYCDQIGKTDLRNLTAAEWDVLLKSAAQNAIGTYRDALQTKLRHEAPF